MKIKENVQLKEYTTFGVGGSARAMCRVQSVDDVRKALQFAEDRGMPLMVLGHGSNVLFDDAGYEGVIMLFEPTEMKLVDDAEKSVVLKVGAGVVWDDLVLHAIENEWWGIENMSLIPGTVGALPIQNVGAYGQDAGQVIESVEAIDRTTGKVCLLNAESCEFSYRQSIFNQAQKGRYIVASVNFRLNKQGVPDRSHRSVAERTSTDSNLLDMRDCIVALREDGRLPSLDRYGSAGSFFQSYFFTAVEFEEKIAIWSERLAPDQIQTIRSAGYKTNEGIKLPVAVLLRVAGVLNDGMGGVGLYAQNPSVMINRTGAASSEDVVKLIELIEQRFMECFGLTLNIEPELVGFKF